MGTYLGKTAPKIPPAPLNSLFPENSASVDSNEDLAQELDGFFRFMIWNDQSREEKVEVSSFTEDEGSISATDLFVEIDDFDDIDGYLPRVSDKRVSFPPFAQ